MERDDTISVPKMALDYRWMIFYFIFSILCILKQFDLKIWVELLIILLGIAKIYFYIMNIYSIILDLYSQIIGYYWILFIFYDFFFCIYNFVL